ncbi:MAG: hypothetical protein ACRDPT_03110 [Streptomycetales bacterium]
MHITQHERELAKAYQRGNNEGLQRGREMGAATAEQNVERLERRVRELEQRLDEAARFYDFDGDQVVEVGGYAYRWRGSMRLAVGDRVLVPENYISRMKHGPGPYEGVVTKLGATYRGELSFIVGRVSTKDA